VDTLGFVVIAAGVITFSLISNRVQAGIVTAPMVFAGFGLLIGEGGLGLADLAIDHGIVHGLAELTLILVLFSDAARIDLRQVRRDHNLPLRMLVVGMPLTVALGAALALVLPFGFSLWEAALLAAILAPTDAALGQAVVSNRRVPVRIRQALNVESGLNDGIALPLVLLFASLASLAPGAAGEENWIAFGLKQITLGPLAGIAIGALGARLIDRAVATDRMSESFEGAAILGLALLAFAGAEVIGGNGFIAAFTAGIVFGNHVRGRCTFIFEFAEAEGQLLVLLTFMIFGAAFLPEALHHVTWTHALYAILSLTVIRMVPVALSLVGASVSLATVGFLGWFGPRGLASFLFALLVLEDSAIPAQEPILLVVICTVALSIVLHGVSAAPTARAYGALAERMGECPENKPVGEMPTRHDASAGTVKQS